MLPFLTVPDQQLYQVPLIALVRPAETKPAEPPKPVEYLVQPGDNLTKIAQSQNTTVERLWEKNIILTDPDQLGVGIALVVPTADEVLADRPLPVAALYIPPAPGTSSAPSRAASSGNTYTKGYCTWYVKNMRPDLPNSLGNADTWYIRYSGPKGSVPAVGAAGVTRSYMHVVYVTAVNGDGTVTVSEMNYKGWNRVSSRTAPASEFSYIY